MFRITLNKSHIYSYYNSYFLYQDIIEVSYESPESLFLRPVSFFKSLFCSGQFLSKFKNKFRTTSLQNTPFLLSLFSLQVSVLFWSLFSISLSKSRTKSLFQNTPFCYPYPFSPLHVPVLFWTIPIQVQGQVQN